MIFLTSSPCPQNHASSFSEFPYYAFFWWAPLPNPMWAGFFPITLPSFPLLALCSMEIWPRNGSRIGREREGGRERERCGRRTRPESISNTEAGHGHGTAIFLPSSAIPLPTSCGAMPTEAAPPTDYDTAAVAPKDSQKKPLFPSQRCSALSSFSQGKIQGVVPSKEINVIAKSRAICYRWS